MKSLPQLNLHPLLEDPFPICIPLGSHPLNRLVSQNHQSEYSDQQQAPESDSHLVHLSKERRNSELTQTANVTEND